MLKGHNPLDINSSSYSFNNFFSTSSLLFFLEIQETCGYSPKLLFISRVFFFFFLLKKVERSKDEITPTDKSSNNNTKQFLHLVTFF